MELSQIKTSLQALLERIVQSIEVAKTREKEDKVRELSPETTKSGFWDDQQHARSVMESISALQSEIDQWRALEYDAKELLQMADLAEGDAQIRVEVEQQLAELTKRLEQLEFTLLFSGPYDTHSAYLSIYAGTGGTDAQDWAEMLLRMYQRYAERKGWKMSIESISEGEEAGIKSVTAKVEGRNSYGHLKAEHGVHRLVRQSPFNAQSLRQTSFALVDVIPVIGQAELLIDDKDLRIDTFRASGHGGQSVNTTDSAVRITHVPTGITVSCQNERSQLQNRERAMAILRSRLAILQQQHQQEETQKLRGETLDADWGSQIRSYVLHPYQMVKDLRSGWETSNTAKIIDGDLDEIIESVLRHQAST